MDSRGRRLECIPLLFCWHHVPPALARLAGPPVLAQSLPCRALRTMSPTTLRHWSFVGIHLPSHLVFVFPSLAYSLPPVPHSDSLSAKWTAQDVNKEIEELCSRRLKIRESNEMGVGEETRQGRAGGWGVEREISARESDSEGKKGGGHELGG